MFTDCYMNYKVSKKTRDKLTTEEKNDIIEEIRKAISDKLSDVHKGKYKSS